MNKRKDLFVACSIVNKLRLTNKIKFDGLMPEDVIYNFIEAIEDIDDQGRIDDVPEEIIDFYEELIGWEEDDDDDEIADLFNSTRPLYEKKRKKKWHTRVKDEWEGEPEEPEKSPTFTRSKMPRKLDI